MHLLPVSLAGTSVGRDDVKATEDLEGGVALNAVVLAEISLINAVDLGKLDVLLLESGGSLLVLGGESLAVATPGSEDWENVMLAGSDLTPRLRGGGVKSNGKPINEASQQRLRTAEPSGWASGLMC